MKQLCAWAFCVLLAGGCRAQSVGHIAQISVIDRDSGLALPVEKAHGEYWVAGRPGARYAIEIRNCSNGRIMAVTSVDGVNVLSGAAAAWDQGGYVFEAAQRYQIAGWRKTDAQVAAFIFTASPNSYAALTGRPANIGVIGVALFQEREARITRSESDPAAAASGALDANANAPRIAQLASRQPAAAAPAEKLGTAHGEREYSYVSHTNFERLQPQPSEIIRIHYDSTENLVAMGIIRSSRGTPHYPNPFPGSPDRMYVPDPPG